MKEEGLPFPGRPSENLTEKERFINDYIENERILILKMKQKENQLIYNLLIKLPGEELIKNKKRIKLINKILE